MFCTGSFLVVNKVLVSLGAEGSGVGRTPGTVLRREDSLGWGRLPLARRGAGLSPNPAHESLLASVPPTWLCLSPFCTLLSLLPRSSSFIVGFFVHKPGGTPKKPK